MTDRVVDLHVTLDSQARDRYPRIPVDLPGDVRSFEVVLEVEDVPGLGIDLGCEGPDGWRGWSGGARRDFVIAEDEATPGYRWGDVRAGRWFVVLGVHTVPASGASVRVRITWPATHRPDQGPVEDPATRLVRGSDRGLPAPEGLTWYAGDFHSHSLHSDGSLSLWELANEGVRSGLDFLAVTDHNTTSHQPWLADVGARQGITLVPGQETTTHMGHANVFGRVGPIDFRRPAREWVAEARRRGALMSINHPVAGDCSWIDELDGIAGAVPEPEAAEIWHSTWYMDPPSRAAIAWLQRWKRGIVLVGGGDFHRRDTPLRPGLPTTWVAAEDDSEDAILDGLRAGRTAITSSGAVTMGGVPIGGIGRGWQADTEALAAMGVATAAMGVATAGGGVASLPGGGVADLPEGALHLVRDLAARAARGEVSASDILHLPGAEARPALMNCPILLRGVSGSERGSDVAGGAGGAGEDLLALAAKGLVLVDLAGRRQVISSDHEVVRAPRERGPYRLEDASRAVLAMSR